MATSLEIRWKLHFRSDVNTVFRALIDENERAGYWAESAKEINGEIHYKFFNGVESHGQIIKSVTNELFQVTYFGWMVTFKLNIDINDGTDMEMTCQGVSEQDYNQVYAGWVSWLMAMKAWVDFRVDLRNHDPCRTWFDGYADN